MSSVKTDRRSIMKKMGLTGLGVIVTSGVAKAFGQVTPPQTEGPFYPIKDQVDKDADLTKVKGRNAEAVGEQIMLRGQVIDAATGAPIAGTLVEFWQACASGKYDHPADPNDAALDPNFQYWAQVMTDHDGRYSIKTIRPGAYPASSDWIRPPHIHVKVHKVGYPSLTTQMYFDGDPLNGGDRILQALSAAQQKLVVVPFSRESSQPAVSEGVWNIYLARRQKIGEKAVNNQLATPELD